LRELAIIEHTVQGTSFATAWPETSCLDEASGSPGKSRAAE
jgi:hypothetical protein